MKNLTELEQINMLLKHANRNGIMIKRFYTYSNRIDMGESYTHTVFAACDHVYEDGETVEAFFTCACFINEFDYKFNCIK